MPLVPTPTTAIWPDVPVPTVTTTENLQAIMRRVWTPRLVEQVYAPSALMKHLAS